MAKLEIKNIKKGFLGTLDFDLQATGQRGFQNFVFYPQDVRSNKFTVQSDKRIGYYYADTGEFHLSKSRSNGSYNLHLILDKLTCEKLSESQRNELNAALQATATNTGNGGIIINNSFASIAA